MDAVLSEGLAPDLDLPDHLDRRFCLHNPDLRGRIVIVFYRGHWCPYCRRYLVKLQSNLPKFAAAGATLIAVSPEPQQTSQALANQLGLHFSLLSDESGEVIERYGVRNQRAGRRALFPHPAVFVVDSDRHIRFQSIDRNFKKRTTMHTIFAALASAQGPNGSSLE